MTKASDIEKELTTTLKIKAKVGEKRQVFLNRVYDAVLKCDKDTWDNLSEAAQKWQGKATDCRDDDEPMIDFDGSAPEAPEAKGKEADGAKGKGKAPAKGKRAAEKADSTPAKGKTKAAAKGDGEGRAVGQKGISAGWVKVLRDLGKKGDEGLSLEQMESLGEKHGVGGRYFARFIRAGYIARIERGQFKLTRAGEKAID